MTDKEKAKAYDSIIEKANKMHSENCDACKACIEELIPELAESKDEKIRKAIIKYITISTISTEGIVCDGVRTKDMLAWLEKQKNIPMIQWNGNNLMDVIEFTGTSPNFSNWFNSFEDYENYVHSHNNIFKLFNEDGSHYEVPVGAWIVKTPDGYIVASKAVLKQKPAEWSEEDEDNFKHLLDEIVCLGNNRNSANRLYYDRLIKFIKELKNRAQPKEKWCDKDERMLDRLIAYFEKQIALTDDDNPRYANWLKSLQNRVQPQPKQEWTEEDRDYYDAIVAKLEVTQEDASLTDNQMDFLKSLRPQNHWKPSEEQMEALKAMARYCEIATSFDAHKQMVVESLYKDLKKAMEEVI